MASENYYYTKEHEWVRIEGDTAVIGISDHAQEALGDITFIELPEAGKKVAQREELGAVESSKAASDIYAPISGTVTEVNEALATEPERVNQDCFGEGWMCKIQVADPEELKGLMNAEEYQEYLKGQ